VNGLKKTWRKRLTSVGIVIVLVGSIFLYNKLTIKNELNEITVVVAKEKIPPRTKITKDMLTTITEPARGVPPNAVADPNKVIGKWTVSGYGFSKNSYIFDGLIVEQSELPDAALLELKEGEVAIPLLVDLETSLGNSIIPKSKVDLYFQSVVSEENEQKALLGKLASNVRVISVKDSQASNVFDEEGYLDENNKRDATKAETSTLAKIYIFAVPEELGKLVNKAKLLGQVFPVATGSTYKEGAEVAVSNDEVISYINKYSNLTTLSANENKEVE